MSFSFSAYPARLQAVGVLAVVFSFSACEAHKKTGKILTSNTCPEKVYTDLRLPENAKNYGTLGKIEKHLYSAGLVKGVPEDAINPYFDEEHIDEWEDFDKGAKSIVEYDPGNHDGMNLRCDYWPKEGYDRNLGFDKPNGRVTLLLPIPDQSSLKCTFVRLNEDRDHQWEAGCEWKNE